MKKYSVKQLKILAFEYAIMHEEGYLDAVSHCSDEEVGNARKQSENFIRQAREYLKKLYE